jgi:hypothetical protein
MIKLKREYSNLILTRDEVERTIDKKMEMVEMMKCPSCSGPIMYKESIINQEQSHEIDDMILRFNAATSDIMAAAQKIYGYDIRLANLATELSKIKRRYTKVNLTILRSELYNG